MNPRRVILLGSTGSIGRQALTVAQRYPERLRIVGLAAGTDLEALGAQAHVVHPAGVALERAPDPGAARQTLAAAAPGARVWVGEGAAAALVRETDAEVVLNGIVGAAGLAASLAALERGARLALANKETLVVGGALVRAALGRGGELIPVDSEHSAAFQCVGRSRWDEVERLVLTASGGALRDHPDWRTATRAEVLAHPVWSMGPRITVDSALLFNKGLELIEAHWLFDLPWERMEAVLHPEAVVHAIVEFRDGSSMVQAAAADMALPIQLALSWPERWDGAAGRIDPVRLAGLTFRPIEPARHPAFAAALAAGSAGGTAPCAVNAADEVAVEAFLSGAIGIAGIPAVLWRVLDSHSVAAVESLEQLAAVDHEARARARLAVSESQAARRVAP